MNRSNFTSAKNGKAINRILIYQMLPFFSMYFCRKKNVPLDSKKRIVIITAIYNTIKHICNE